MAKIFLVSKSGVEWNIPVEAWHDKKKAEKRAKELDKTLNMKDVFDSLSSHVVTPVPLMDDDPTSTAHYATHINEN